MRVSKAQRTAFQRKIFTWWEKNRRDLPWRHTGDPYKILVSEIMLQQTQVSRVLPKYREFLEVYPTVQALAKATPAAIIRIWKGMGYNRRALYLHACAQTVVKVYRGVFPKTEKELTQLPGLGTYTARALMVFAYKQDVATVDTNIRQIIEYYFFGGKSQTPNRVMEVAEHLVPKGKSWEWHQALMDYGSIEMPSLRIKKVKKKDSVPFRETNRFFRGRIMDLLREKERPRDEIIDHVEKTYDRTEEFVEGILVGLAKDGLIEIKKNTVSLPR